MQSLTYSEFIPKKVNDIEEEEEELPRQKSNRKSDREIDFKEYFTNDNCPTCHRKFVFVFDSFDFIILIFIVLMYIVLKK